LPFYYPQITKSFEQLLEYLGLYLSSEFDVDKYRETNSNDIILQSLINKGKLM